MGAKRGLSAVGAVLLAMGATAAAAQSGGRPDPFARERGTAVRDRPQPNYQPVGARLGGFVLHPKVEAATEVAGLPAIVPSIAGWARMTGYNTIFIDDRDPLANGFILI